jgi:hypothetical protein
LFDDKGNPKKKYIHDDSDNSSDSDAAHKGKSHNKSHQQQM